MRVGLIHGANESTCAALGLYTAGPLTVTLSGDAPISHHAAENRSARRTLFSVSNDVNQQVSIGSETCSVSEAFAMKHMTVNPPAMKK